MTTQEHNICTLSIHLSPVSHGTLRWAFGESNVIKIILQEITSW